jgi:hypothetical protein
LKNIAAELITNIRNTFTINWTMREQRPREYPHHVEANTQKIRRPAGSSGRRRANRAQAGRTTLRGLGVKRRATADILGSGHVAVAKPLPVIGIFTCIRATSRAA